MAAMCGGSISGLVDSQQSGSSANTARYHPPKETAMHIYECLYQEQNEKPLTSLTYIIHGLLCHCVQGNLHVKILQTLGGIHPF